MYFLFDGYDVCMFKMHCIFCNITHSNVRNEITEPSSVELTSQLDIGACLVQLGQVASIGSLGLMVELLIPIVVYLD